VRRPVRRGVRGALTLVEVLIVLAVVLLLVAILCPSLASVRARALLGGCAGRMRGISAGLMMYAGANSGHLPPFAFSDYEGNLPLSGHWGGPSQASDPNAFGRQGVGDVNLWRLVARGHLPPGQLICPAADADLAAGESSYFPHTFKFSTYCLRAPYSGDLFSSAPRLAGWAGRGLLGIYTQAGGGIRFHLGIDRVAVPCARVDGRYAEADASVRPTRVFEWASGAVLSDTFWYRGRHRPAPHTPGVLSYPVRADWWHGGRFNVLFGGGSVGTIADDGTVAANAAGPETAPPDDGAYHATQALRVWRHFEDRR